MHNIGRSMDGIGNKRNSDGYLGPISSTGNGGKSSNVNNLNGSQLRGLISMLPYGISSRPLAKMKGQVITNGNGSDTLVGVYDDKRPNVEPGEVLLYSIGKSQIYLDKAGNIAIKTGETLIVADKSGTINIVGDVNITGSLTVDGRSI